MKNIIITVALLLITNAANAVSVSSGGVFDMYDPTGELIHSDSSIYGFVDQDAGTWGVSSPFFFRVKPRVHCL